MGSHISIGLVYASRGEETAGSELRRVLESLTNRSGRIIEGKASLDAEGQSWVEVSPRDNRDAERLYGLVVEGYYGEIDLVADLLGRSRLAITIRLVRSEHYFGFLVDFCENDILDSSSPWQQQLAAVTAEIVELVNELYRVSRFDYAFCDEEGQIEYSPDDFRAAGYRTYSLAFLPAQNERVGTLSVLKSSWEIDGLTPRG